MFLHRWVAMRMHARIRSTVRVCKVVHVSLCVLACVSDCVWEHVRMRVRSRMRVKLAAAWAVPSSRCGAGEGIAGLSGGPLIYGVSFPKSQ